MRIVDGPPTNYRVAVVVLTYGNFICLERTLRSVTEQNYHADAVLVSDDASGKAFPSALQEKFPDVRFQIQKKNLGIVAHMNAVAAQTQTEYIKFLACGDAFSDPEALETLLAFAEKENAPVVTSQAMVCTRELERRLYPFPGKRIQLLKGSCVEQFRTLARTNLISAPGTLFRRSFFIQMGGFDESYHLLEDWPTWLRLTRQGNAIPLLDRVTCLYAVGGISSENGDAFCAPALREDMKLCYEKEIFPYLEGISPKEKKEIQFYYERLNGAGTGQLLRRYFWLEVKVLFKCAVKQRLLRG